MSPSGITRPKWVNPSGAEAGIFRKIYVNTMAADVLAPGVARSSAAMVLIIQDKQSVSSLTKDFSYW